MQYSKTRFFKFVSVSVLAIQAGLITYAPPAQAEWRLGICRTLFERLANLRESDPQVLRRFRFPLGVPNPLAKAEFDLGKFAEFETRFSQALTSDGPYQLQELKTREEKTAAIVAALKAFAGEDLGLAVGDPRVARAVLHSVDFNLIFHKLTATEAAQIVDTVIEVASPANPERNQGFLHRFQSLAVDEIDASVNGAFSRSAYRPVIDRLVKASLMKRPGIFQRPRLALAEDPWLIPGFGTLLLNGVLITLNLPHLTGWPLYMVIPVGNLLWMRAHRYIPLDTQTLRNIESHQPLSAIQSARSLMKKRAAAQAFITLARRTTFTGAAVGILWLGYSAYPLAKELLEIQLSNTRTESEHPSSSLTPDQRMEEDFKAWLKTLPAPPTQDEVQAQRKILERYKASGGYDEPRP